MILKRLNGSTYVLVRESLDIFDRYLRLIRVIIYPMKHLAGEETGVKLSSNPATRT